MSNIWLIEAHSRPCTGVLGLLQGNYATRAFGSVASFETLAMIDRSSPPDAVVVNMGGFVEELEVIELLISRCFGDALQIFLTGAQDVALLQKPGRYIMSVDTDPMKLKSHLEQVLGMSRSGASQSTYRDLMLDSDDQRFTIFGEEPESLTQKEYLLLNLFLRNTGQCIGRDRFIDEVWHGVKVSPRTIDSHVSRLRRRLSMSQVTIESVYGGGYLLR